MRLYPLLVFCTLALCTQLPPFNGATIESFWTDNVTVAVRPAPALFKGAFYQWVSQFRRLELLTHINKGTTSSIKEAILTDTLGHAPTPIIFEDFTDLAQFTSLFEDTDSVFVKRDRLQIIYHDHDRATWRLQTFEASAVLQNPVMGPRVALSKCLSTAHGKTGSVATLFRVTVKALLAATGKSSAVDAVLFLLAGLLKLGGAASLTGLLVCPVGTAQYGQPYLHPIYLQVPAGKVADVELTDSQGLLITLEWLDTPPDAKLAALSPVLECSVGNSLAVCEDALGAYVGADAHPAQASPKPYLALIFAELL